MLTHTSCTLCLNAGEQCWVGSLSAKFACYAENGCITTQCGVIVAHSQYMGSDAVNNSLSESFIALAVGNPPYEDFASSAATQLPSNWAEP